MKEREKQRAEQEEAVPPPPDPALDDEEFEQAARKEALEAPIEVIRERLAAEGIDSEQVAREILQRVEKKRQESERRKSR